MKSKQILKMIFSVDSADRNFAGTVVDRMIESEEINELSDLRSLLEAYQNYPGYEITLCKERIEERIDSYLNTTF
jgi:hypothetical protein